MHMTTDDQVGNFSISGELSVRRLGFGAMRLTGPGVWGPPRDVPAARAVLRRALELGVNFIDTADVYGPGDNERLIRDALAPFPKGLVIATKGGVTRTGPATRENPGMGVDNSEAHLRAAVENSLRNLGLERVELYQLHRVDARIPIEETMGVLAALRNEGKIRYVGLSEVSVEQLVRARTVLPIATVQNEYNLANRRHEGVLEFCADHEIGFIPFYPLKLGPLADHEALHRIARRERVTAANVALAWVLAKAATVIAIPGTSSLEHLAENVAACRIKLSAADMNALNGLTSAEP